MCSCQQQNTPIPQQTILEPCIYTVQTVIYWKNILFCIRDNELLGTLGLTQVQFNSYIGILLSCINSNEACYFKSKLDEINIYIIKTINLNICPTI